MNRLIQTITSAPGHKCKKHHDYMIDDCMTTLRIHDGTTYTIDYQYLVLTDQYTVCVSSIEWRTPSGRDMRMSAYYVHSSYGCVDMSHVITDGMVYRYKLNIEDIPRLLACERKYHEHAGNVYIAATAWRFKYPTDCAITFA